MSYSLTASRVVTKTSQYRNEGEIKQMPLQLSQMRGKQLHLCQKNENQIHSSLK